MFLYDANGPFPKHRATSQWDPKTGCPQQLENSGPRFSEGLRNGTYLCGGFKEFLIAYGIFGENFEEFMASHIQISYD